MPPITPAVRKLMIWNVAIFAVSLLLSFRAGLFVPVYEYLSLNPGQWGLNFPHLPLWQFVTYGFLHSVNSLGHLVFNMLALFFFGTMLEQLVGSRKFLVTYFGAMIAGGLLHLVMEGLIGPGIPAVGASGAVLGVLIAAAAMRPATPVIFLIFPMTLRTMALIIVTLDAFAILTMLRDGANSNIAHWVHLGGALFGFLWVRSGAISTDFVGRFEAKKRQKALENQRSDEARMDELLAKIQRDGMPSLSDKDRAFLKKMSDRKRP